MVWLQPYNCGRFVQADLPMAFLKAPNKSRHAAGGTVSVRLCAGILGVWGGKLRGGFWTYKKYQNWIFTKGQLRGMVRQRLLQEGMDMKQNWTTRKMVYTAVLAALVCAVTFFRFPLFGSKIHFANAMCLLSGLLMGPLAGGLAAGLGSALYDALFGGYDLLNCAITFATKFLMAWICAKIAFSGGRMAESHSRNTAACVAGALSYVVMYMLKTFVFQMFVYGYPMETAVATMGSKLPASLLNAIAAMAAAPVLFAALYPALRRTGQMEHMRA